MILHPTSVPYILYLYPITLCRLQIRELYHPGVVYAKLMELMGRLAELGLVHCDFNEFNVLVRRRLRARAIGYRAV